MDGGLLSLKWNNHRSTFFYVLSNVRKKECYTDVTIACDGKFYPVHKLILSTCSEYFEQMFEQTQCKHPVIVLKDIRSEELESLLSYMYVGEVNVVQEKLSGLIKAAECLRIKGLAVPDEEPQTTKSSGGSREKRTSDNSLSSDAKRRRQDDSSFSSPKQSSTSNSREDSNRRRGDQSSSNKFSKNSTSSNSNSSSTVNSSRETRDNERTSISNNREAPQSSELQQSAAIEEGIELKAEEPPDVEEDLPAEVVPTSDVGDPVKQEPIDLDAVYLSDSNSASDTKDMLVEDSFGETDGQQHFMDELLGHNSASDQQGSVGDYGGEGGEGSSSGATSNQQQHMVPGVKSELSEDVRSKFNPVPTEFSSVRMASNSTQLPTPIFPHPSETRIPSNAIVLFPLCPSFNNSTIAELHVRAQHAEGGALEQRGGGGGKALTSPPVPVTPYSELNLDELRTECGAIKCPQCGKQFFNNFIRHYKVHTHERAHACLFCPYRSSRRDDLNRHLKVHSLQM